MKKIENIKQVESLISETYMYAIIIAIAALLLVFIISNLIKYQGGAKPTDHITRRVWYIIIGVISPIGFYLYNAWYVSSLIAKPALKAKFSTANLYTALLILGIYIILGIITMLIMRSSKWGSVLGKSKK